MLKGVRPGVILVPVAAFGVVLFSGFWCVAYVAMPHLRAFLDDPTLGVPPYRSSVRTIWNGVTRIGSD